jgi:hypothetical protein
VSFFVHRLAFLVLEVAENQDKSESEKNQSQCDVYQFGSAHSVSLRPFFLFYTLLRQNG